jgi:hypothetical protein
MPVQFAGCPYLERPKDQFELVGCSLTFCDITSCAFLVVWIYEQRHTRHAGYNRLEIFHALRSQIICKVGQSCNVSTRMREAGHELAAHGIRNIYEDDGDRGGRTLGG